jgi:arylsulfatase A-like enzyme
MNRRKFLRTAAVATSAASRAKAAQPPNIVLICADDLGYGDLGCYGSRVKTPNFNQLAAQGVVFRHCNSASPVCSPARAALLTGRYPTRVGVPTVLVPTDTYGLADSEITVAKMLKPMGYSTMCVGKWHLGSLPQYLPTNRGFDEYYGIPYSNDMSPSVLLHNTDIIEQPVQLNTLIPRYTSQATSFIQRSQNTPFFLYLAYNAPHLPLIPSAAFSGTSAQGAYGDVVQEMDWSLGQVLGALAAGGLDQNTLVMFTSDHGPWFNGSANKLRGRKSETWEGGVRVPFIARFPGSIPNGRVVHNFVNTLDILPTIAGVTGASLPLNPLDGVNIWPMLTGQQDAVEHDVFLYFDYWNLQCARMGRWKLHMSRYNTFPWSPDPVGGRMNLPLTPELYDVESDPGESYDTAPAYPQIVATIRARVDELRAGFPSAVQSAWTDTFSHKCAPTVAGELPSL